MKRKILAMSLVIGTLVVFPLAESNVTYSSAGTVSQTSNEEKVIVTPPTENAPLVSLDGSTGTISKSIYVDYDVGSGYPTSKYYEEFHPTFGKMAGTFYVSDIYLINGGKQVRVWYHGQLSRV